MSEYGSISELKERNHRRREIILDSINESNESTNKEKLKGNVNSIESHVMDYVYVSPEFDYEENTLNPYGEDEAYGVEGGDFPYDNLYGNDYPE